MLGVVADGPIDRKSLVQSFNPLVVKVDPFSALSVGNGEFAFTADITGLQTFLEDYHTDFPLCTASHWGWHTSPMPAGVNPADFRYQNFDTYGRPVGYDTSSAGQEPLFNWMRENPHRLHLGRIGLEITRADGSLCKSSDLSQVRQELDLWSGSIDSRFTVESSPARVLTCVHPEMDLLAVRIESPMLRAGKMRVVIAFPYGSSAVDMADWSSPDKHQTQADISGNRAEFLRILDADRYCVSLEFTGGTLQQRAAHEFVLNPTGDVLELICDFGLQHQTDLPGFSETAGKTADHWEDFWTTGAAVDLTASSHPQAPELQRRIILSQYNTALHCAGSLPSAETGLLFNSWYGKFHLEMHWWHSVHFTMWNRFDLFSRNTDFYQRILPIARQIAQRQGYAGARWPKMVGPDGHDSPSPVGPLLIWQQPHPIYYAELCYQHSPGSDVLSTWKEIVFATADFMASYAVKDAGGRYVLGPPMKTVSENADTLTTKNPTFELAYWRFGLKTAQAWRTRLGMPPDARYAEVLANLSPLPTQNGLYLMQEGMTDTYEKWNWEHPALLGALGMQPGAGVEPATMRATIQKVMQVWQWDRAWGWDFPMAAMCAARVGEPELAIQALLIDSPKNRYHPNGHVYQRPGLTAYLPGNGALLDAIGMMAGGWRGSGNSPAPGFPKDGKWAVKCEGLGTWL